MSTYDTKLQAEPVCPACGHRHRDAWEWHFDGDMDGSAKRECDACGAEFQCDRIVSVDYTTRLITKEKPE